MGLRASKHTGNLLALYSITIVMRASFFISVAVTQSLSFMGGGLHEWEIAAVMIVDNLVELALASFFGSYGDKIGRRPILIASLFITATAAYLFAIAPTAAILIVFSAVFGIGAAAKVSTTLSMIADMSSEHDRARLMGYYHLSTLTGLAGGFGLGIILLERTISPSSILFMAGLACAMSGIIAFFAIKETRTHVQVDISMLSLIKKVAMDRKIQMLIPVYVPIIAMYGLLIGYAGRIIEDHFDLLTGTDLLYLFGGLGGSLILGTVIMGHLSDHYVKRRPFIVTGLIGFGILGYLMVAYADNLPGLWAIWPALPLLGFMAGAFPPAAMAYLTDVSEKEARGATMGVYSIFFGTGMIIGPLAGAFAYSNYGLYGMAILVGIFITIAIAGTYFLPERHHKEEGPKPESAN